MSATLCEEPPRLRAELTLEQLLARAYEVMHADGVAECAVCGGELTANELEARCGDCGARLF